jgi:hypothetical protein
MKPESASSGSVSRCSEIISRIASSASARSASEPAISQRREIRSASMPAGIANKMNGSVSAVCNRPVWPSPTPSSNTATMGAAARAICSADCADRLDQARRLKVAGKRDGLSVEDMVLFPGLSVCRTPWASRGRLSHPLPDMREGTLRTVLGELPIQMQLQMSCNKIRYPPSFGDGCTIVRFVP